MTARKWASNADANSKKLTNLGAPTAASSDAARISDVEAASTNDRSRANHTGTQTASTISDFDTAVRLNRLDQLAVPTGPVALNNQKITGLADGTAATDAATKGQLDAALSAAASAQILKGGAKVAVGTNVNIANPGTAVFDGITLSNGDIAILYGQSTGSQNGPMVFNGSGSAMTRPANWDSAGEAVVGSYWLVAQGTQADKFAMMTNDTFTLGTTTAAFQFTPATVGGGSASSFAANMGNGAATSFTINHALNTRDLIINVYRNGSPWDDIDVYTERTDANNVTVKPDEVWATNEFRIVINKVA